MNTSMTYWWPIVSAQCPTVPMPRTVTVFVKNQRALFAALDGKRLPDELLKRVAAACAKVGFPCFLRGDLTSGKHNYAETCFIAGPKHLAPHMFRLIEDSVLGPGSVPSAFYAREYLKLEAPFKAFKGLPIARERRYFVEDGEVICHHPYWPADAIRFSESGSFGPEGWSTMLRAINREGVKEVAQLSEYAALLGKAIGGAWSLDFARDVTRKWWFIDAAEAHLSWHSEHR